MDPDSFRERVAAAKRTELDRLGSAELVVALTDGDPDGRSVLAAAAHSEHAARETFRRWADDEPDGAVRAAFERVADQEDEHLDRVLEALGESVDLADGGPMHAYLRSREDAVERLAAGLVGRGLVVTRTHGRLVSFFASQSERATASLFEDLESETEDEIATGLELLAERCARESDWERALATAEYAIQVASDDVADALSALGVDPAGVA